MSDPGYLPLPPKLSPTLPSTLVQASAAPDEDFTLAENSSAPVRRQSYKDKLEQMVEPPPVIETDATDLFLMFYLPRPDNDSTRVVINAHSDSLTVHDVTESKDDNRVLRRFIRAQFPNLKRITVQFLLITAYGEPSSIDCKRVLRQLVECRKYDIDLNVQRNRDIGDGQLQGPVVTAAKNRIIEEFKALTNGSDVKVSIGSIG